MYKHRHLVLLCRATNAGRSPPPTRSRRKRTRCMWTLQLYCTVVGNFTMARFEGPRTSNLEDSRAHLGGAPPTRRSMWSDWTPCSTLRAWTLHAYLA